MVKNICLHHIPTYLVPKTLWRHHRNWSTCFRISLCFTMLHPTYHICQMIMHIMHATHTIRKTRLHEDLPLRLLGQQSPAIQLKLYSASYLIPTIVSCLLCRFFCTTCPVDSVHLHHLINDIATVHTIAMLCDATPPLKSTSVQTTTMMHDANEIELLTSTWESGEDITGFWKTCFFSCISTLIGK